MNWFQQPNNSWQASEAEADADMLAGRMAQNNKVLKDWQDYAAKLEATVSKVRSMYEVRTGDEQAQATLKELALAEIQRLDPGNRLLDPEYRKEIGNKAREESAKNFANKKYSK